MRRSRFLSTAISWRDESASCFWSTSSISGCYFAAATKRARNSKPRLRRSRDSRSPKGARLPAPAAERARLPRRHATREVEPQLSSCNALNGAALGLAAGDRSAARASSSPRHTAGAARFRSPPTNCTSLYARLTRAPLERGTSLKGVAELLAPLLPAHTEAASRQTETVRRRSDDSSVGLIGRMPTHIALRRL